MSIEQKKFKEDDPFDIKIEEDSPKTTNTDINFRVYEFIYN